MSKSRANKGESHPSEDHPGSIRTYMLTGFFALFFLLEMLACYVSHSLVLLMNTYQTFFNLLSLSLILISHHITRNTNTLKNTFGWVRLEVVGTLVAVLFLFALCFAITTTAIQTLVHAAHEDTEPKFPILIMAFGLVGLSLDIICYMVMGDPNNMRDPGSYISVQGNRVQVNFVESGSSHGLNKYPCSSVPAGHCERGTQAFLESSEKCEGRGDRKPPSLIMEALRTSGSGVLVVITAVLLHFLKGEPIARYLDSVLALVTVVIIVVTFYPYMKNSGLILLQTVPDDIDIEKLQRKILNKFTQLINIHDLHIWTLNDENVIATIHISLARCEQAEYEDLASEIDDFFKESGIKSVTIQPEFIEPPLNGEAGAVKCALKCSRCSDRTCCIEDNQDPDVPVFAARKRNGSKESLIISPSLSGLAKSKESEV